MKKDMSYTELESGPVVRMVDGQDQLLFVLTLSVRPLRLLEMAA